MAWMDAISDIFNRYSGTAGGAASAPADPHHDYCNISEASGAKSRRGFRVRESRMSRG